MRVRSVRRALCALLLAAGPVAAQAPAAPAWTTSPARDVLRLEAAVSTEVVPDVAVFTFAAEASGSDAAALTREVQQSLQAGLAAVREMRGIEARTGSFTTQPRWSPRGIRDGWIVRAELVLKSKDFSALGALASKLAQQKLMIVSSGFEISRELREREESILIEQGIAAFQGKARTAARAFGFSNVGLLEVNLGAISSEGRALARASLARAASAEAAATAAEPLPIEGGRVILTLSVSGTVQLLR
ncbi:MAG: SIMPL domain-containing protein [Casimicrobiaceae bacterium]|nr:SIMPL domain-containing protein [Casimicrobiaceae bacterium]